MVKINRSVTLDLEIYEEARKANINISEACEQGLADALHRNLQNRPGDVYSRAMNRLLELITDADKCRCQGRIKENPQKAVGWMRVFKRNYGVVVTPKEIVEVFG